MRNFISFILVIIAISSTSTYAEVRYNIKDLGTLGRNCYAQGLNNKGQITGYSQSEFGTHSFIYDSENGMQDIGTLGGDASYAFDINDNGMIVGFSDTSRDHLNNRNHAFVYDSSSNNPAMKDLGTLGGLSSHAYAINNKDKIVGSSSTSNNEMHAFFYNTRIGMHDLGTLGGDESEANDINNKGQIIGFSNNEYDYYGFIYDTNNGLQSIDPYFSAEGINDMGQVIGYKLMPRQYNGYNETQAFLYDSKNGMQNIGSLGGHFDRALAINNLGQIVGKSDDQAFLYDSVKGMQNLNDLIDPQLGYTLTYANDINDKGQIISFGYGQGIYQKSFLLTPVPEPATLALITTGAAFIVRKRRS